MDESALRVYSSIVGMPLAGILVAGRDGHFWPYVRAYGGNSGGRPIGINLRRKQAAWIRAGGQGDRKGCTRESFPSNNNLNYDHSPPNARRVQRPHVQADAPAQDYIPRILATKMYADLRLVLGDTALEAY